MSEIATAILKAANHPVALFVDFDGTLVDLAETPDAISVAPDLPRLVEDVSRVLDGAFAIISGRPIADIDRFLGHPAVAISGSHGAEFRLADGRETGLGPETAAETRDIAQNLAHLTGLDDRILVEPKAGSVAVHFRLVPEHAEECRAAVKQIVENKPGWTMSAGKAIVEARLDGVNKGGAVRNLMANETFAGRTPVFVGDDVTDEDGMAVATQLGGFGVKVGDGETVARFRIADVSTAHALLKNFAETGDAPSSEPQGSDGRAHIPII